MCILQEQDQDRWSMVDFDRFLWCKFNCITNKSFKAVVVFIFTDYKLLWSTSGHSCQHTANVAVFSFTSFLLWVLSLCNRSPSHTSLFVQHKCTFDTHSSVLTPLLRQDLGSGSAANTENDEQQVNRGNILLSGSTPKTIREVLKDTKQTRTTDMFFFFLMGLTHTGCLTLVMKFDVKYT